MIKKYYIEKVALWRKIIFLRFSSVDNKSLQQKKEVCGSQTLYSIRGAMVIFNQIDSTFTYVHYHDYNLVTFCHKIIHMYISSAVGIGQERK